jgi:hypothetical protein
MTKVEFEDWLMKSFGNGKKFWQDSNEGDVEWCDAEKLDILNWLALNGARFAMIRRGEARKKI